MGERRLRIRLRDETYRTFQRLEALARRWLPRTVSFIRFLSLCVWAAHRPANGSTVAYAEIYWRDGHRCTNPVCTSRAVTPHHLEYRSHGGDDSAGNVTSLCVECHLSGVHGGRIRVDPPAEDLHWRLGEDAGLVVHGREVISEAT